ncbi:hypothetical protein AB1E33_18545 [Ruegeria sp. 2012CJ15-1]
MPKSEFDKILILLLCTAKIDVIADRYDGSADSIGWDCKAQSQNPSASGANEMLRCSLNAPG